MSFSKKDLFREIKIKCESFKDEDYLINAISIIDSTIETAQVDNAFINEFYKLKRRIVFENTFYSTVVLGLIVGLILLCVHTPAYAPFWAFIVYEKTFEFEPLVFSRKPFCFARRV